VLEYEYDCLPSEGGVPELGQFSFRTFDHAGHGGAGRRVVGGLRDALEHDPTGPLHEALVRCRVILRLELLGLRKGVESHPHRLVGAAELEERLERVNVRRVLAQQDTERSGPVP
jgi:hypothetical protein